MTNQGFSSLKIVATCDVGEYDRSMKVGKLTRKEHIVPEMLLSQFVGDDGKLWVYAKNHAPRPSIPRRECVERDFYEFEHRGKTTDNRYENWLSQIEGDAAQLLQSILQRRRLRKGDAEAWGMFVSSLFGRTKKVRSQITGPIAERLQEWTERPDSIRDLHYRMQQMGHFYSADEIRRAAEECLISSQKYPSFAHTHFLPNRAKMLLPCLLERVWYTIEAPAESYFLMSDCPVLTVEFRNSHPLPGSGFANEDTVVFLPISPRHLFVASPHHIAWNDKAEARNVRSFNRLIAQFAHRNVYASVKADEISRVVDAEMDTAVFGVNAFFASNN